MPTMSTLSPESRDAPAPYAFPRWATSSTVPPSPRSLSLQLLQVTALSITFALSYDIVALASSSSSPNNSVQAPTAPAASLAATTAPVHPNPPPNRPSKTSRGRRRRKPVKHHVHHSSDDGGGHNDDGEEDEDSTAVESDHVSALDRRPKFASLLSKGLAVTVNGSPWMSVAAHVGQGVDEAVVVVYGLSPGRLYKVEIGLVGDEDKIPVEPVATASCSTPIPLTASTTASTPPTTTALSSAAPVSTTGGAGTSTVRSRSRANSLRTRSRANSASSNHVPPPSVSSQQSSAQVALGSSSSGAPASSPLAMPQQQPVSLPSPPVAPAGPLTPDQLLILLQQHLTHSQSQQEILSADLKAHRKASQKTDASLRSSIAALQKSMEKTGPADLRGRQKVLALGESVKRLVSAKEDSRQLEESAGVEAGALEEVERGETKEWENAKAQAEEIEAERDEVVTSNEKRLAEWESELGGLISKLEKLTAKHDKLSSQITTYDQRLSGIAKEKEDLAAGTHSVLQEAAAAITAAQMSSTSTNAYDVNHSPQYASRTVRGTPAAVAARGGFTGSSGSGAPNIAQQQQLLRQQHALVQQQQQQREQRERFNPVLPLVSRPVPTSQTSGDRYSTPQPSPTGGGPPFIGASPPSTSSTPPNGNSSSGYRSSIASTQFYRPSQSMTNAFGQSATTSSSPTTTPVGTPPPPHALISSSSPNIPFAPFGDLTSPGSPIPSNSSSANAAPSSAAVRRPVVSSGTIRPNFSQHSSSSSSTTTTTWGAGGMPSRPASTDGEFPPLSPATSGFGPFNSNGGHGNGRPMLSSIFPSEGGSSSNGRGLTTLPERIPLPMSPAADGF